MKLFYILLLALPLLCHSHPTAKEEKSITIDEDDIADVELDSDHAESETDSKIQKRSGSFDYVTHLKTGLLSSIGHASASIASGSSGGSSGGGTYKSHDSGHHGNSVEYDPWSFKKTVLNTIFQAVKAITGGVTALKGQLIKGSGYALSASGNLVAASGDKVTDVGKAIINSAQIHTHPIYGGGGHSGGGSSSVHPFAKFSSLSGASSGGSSGDKHSGGGPVVHTETITTYEIPSGHGGHGSYGPPSKPPTYSSVTHQYLPPPPSNSYSGGAPFSGGHVAFEAPPSNYLPTAYGQDGHDDFNIYGRHKQLTDEEARKAAIQLQEVLNLLPNGKTEFTASKTVSLDTSGSGDVHPQNVEIYSNGLPQDLGPLESLSHTESITAAYGTRPQQQENPSDIYHQMAKKQRVEEIYIQKHPNEGYNYQPPKEPDTGYKYNNYHAVSTNNALNDLTPIIAALEVAKRNGGAANHQPVSTQIAIEKNVHRIPPPGNNQFKYLPPVVEKTKYTYFDPAQNRADRGYGPRPYDGGPVYVPPYGGSPYKVRRQAIAPPNLTRRKRKLPPPFFNPQDYQIQDPLLFNRLFSE